MKNSHIYANLPSDQMEELFSNFIIDSWSYSKVNTFSRNEKVFEMNYVYRQHSKSSSSTIAGQAYHAALEQYFKSLKEGVIIDLVGLERIAFEFIDEIPANYWKLQKTTPTIDNCINEACKTVSLLLKNFIGEIKVYTSKIKRILYVELSTTQWVKINGVDIPIPCNAKLDLVVETIYDKIAIIDHKSKRAFTDEIDFKLVAGRQAITYASVYEALTGIYPDEVWFIENKYSKNKDGSPQLVPFEIKLDHDTRRLYEALLYEPLKRMIEAISDPDYVYIINDNDSFADKAELFEFWMKTMIAEVDDFNIPEDKKEMVQNRLRKIRDATLATVSPTAIKNFQKNASTFIPYDLTNKDMTNKEKIEHVLSSFGKTCRVEHEFTGYSSNTYLLEISAGINIKSVYSNRLDIANALNVNNVRMGQELFVYGGKSYLANESSKKSDKILYWDAKYLNDMKIPIGKDNFEQTIYWDLNNPTTPHVLVCGGTGSGKSVCLKSTIEYSLLSGVENIYIMDPKAIDFNEYKGRKGVEVFNDIEDIEAMMSCLVGEMQSRVKTGKNDKILIVFDEFADAVANSRKGSQLKVYENVIIGEYKNGLPKTKRVQIREDKSLEENLRILLQKGRALGFRIVSATQRASTNIITGDAKVNMPVQICFKVQKEIDSRVVIDEPGAESLSGNGDGLIKSPEYSNTIRFQGFFKK